MTRYRKVYKTRSNETVIPMKVGDVTVEAHFRNGNVRDNEWAKLETTDPVAQFVIEHSPLYGKVILLDSMSEVEEPEVEKELTPDTVATLAEARQYLVDNFGENAKSLSSPNAVRGSMARHGILFPNWTK